jgi:hypothetical protein
MLLKKNSAPEDYKLSISNTSCSSICKLHEFFRPSSLVAAKMLSLLDCIHSGNHNSHTRKSHCNYTEKKEKWQHEFLVEKSEIFNKNSDSLDEIYNHLGACFCSSAK